MNGEINDIVDGDYLRYLELKKNIKKYLCNNIIIQLILMMMKL